MKKISVLILFILFSLSTKAQNAKVIYGEIGGPGLLVSTNFDMRLTSKESGLGFRVGFGIVIIPIIFESAISIPFELNYLIGKDRKNYLEFGLGFSYVSVYSNDLFNSDDVIKGSFSFASIGYRYSPAGGSTFFKIAFYPLLWEKITPYGGIGFGYKF